MDRSIWGERRLLVPGIVFLAVVAILAGLSGSFTGGDEDQRAGILAVAAVLAAGIAGYPLGIMMYIPFRLAWDLFGGYGLFFSHRGFCTRLAAVMSSMAADQGVDVPPSLLGEAERGSSDPHSAMLLYGAIYERYAPESTMRPARGRWDTVHTEGGRMVALVFGIGLSPLLIAVTGHEAPWWDRDSILIAVSAFAFAALGLLGTHFACTAMDAAGIERQWSERWLDCVQRRPELLEAIALNEEFASWVATSK